MLPIRFHEVRLAVVAALLSGDYQFEARRDIDVKNLLATGEISAAKLAALIRRTTGDCHSVSPHHRVPSVVVHVLRYGGWYVKFYFLEPDTWFISVHK